MELVSKYSDVFLAAFVVLVVGMMIIPLPTLLLDVLLTLNIAIGITILLVVLYISSAIRLASFPSLLLIATLFRLALNVSTTRLILLRADAGEVIEAFGRFVVQGNIIVGAIVFLILTLVNFIVISKGSERVAEVAARFTLDAMPGKQMAIDADLRAGAFDLNEAKAKRRELSRESQLFGAMDGAMKFVKGDAIAGIIITLINIMGGVVVGVLVRDMAAIDALKVYGLLTIGDGLLSQIPALIVSVAAGLMVTRVEPESSGDHLGRDISHQLLGNPKALTIVALLLFLLGVVPGLPLFPFWCLGTLVASIAIYVSKTAHLKPALESNGLIKENSSKKNNDILFSIPSAICVELGSNVAQQLQADCPDSRFFSEVIPRLRYEIYMETGVQIPGIRIGKNPTSALADSFVVYVMESPVYTGTLPPGRALLENADEKVLLIAGGGEAASDSLSEKGMLIPINRQNSLEAAGYQVYSGEDLFIYQMRKLLIQYASEFIGIQEVKWLCDEMEKVFPDTVSEAIPRVITYQRLGDVLRRLVQESVCIRDLKRILEAVTEFADVEPDNVALTEKVRGKLARQLHNQYSSQNQLKVFLLDSDLESIFQSSIHVSGNERFLAMDPDLMEKVVSAFQRHLKQSASNGVSIILTVEQNIRYVLWRFLAQQMRDIRVLAEQEMPPGTQFVALGSISLSE